MGDSAMLDLATAMQVLATLLLALPLLLSLLSVEPTLVPDVTLPTLLELSMLLRGRLRLMPSTVLMVLDMLVLATLVLATLVLATVMPVLAMLPRLSLPLPLLLLLWLLLLLSPLSLPATPTCPPLPPSPPLELPLLPSLLSEEPTPVLVVTLPTLLESSMPLKRILRTLCFVGFK